MSRALWQRRPVGVAPSRGMTYPATADAVRAARRQVVQRARAAGARPESVADIELAVGEASANAVVHAYASPGVRGRTFTVATATKGATFRVWVTDEGRGEPADGPSPGAGLGLELMAVLCQQVLIGVLGDGRTQVEMRFDLRVATAA